MNYQRKRQYALERYGAMEDINGDSIQEGDYSDPLSDVIANEEMIEEASIDSINQEHTLVKLSEAVDTIDLDKQVVDNFTDRSEIPPDEVFTLLRANQERIIKTLPDVLSDEFKGTDNVGSITSISTEAILDDFLGKAERLKQLSNLYAQEKVDLLAGVAKVISELERLVHVVINGVINLIDIQGNTVIKLETMYKKLDKNKYDNNATFKDPIIAKGLIVSTDTFECADALSFSGFVKDISSDIGDTIKKNIDSCHDIAKAVNADVANSSISRTAEYLTKSIENDNHEKTLSQSLKDYFKQKPKMAFCGLIMLDDDTLGDIDISDKLHDVIEKPINVIHYDDIPKVLSNAKTSSESLKKHRGALNNLAKANREISVKMVGMKKIDDKFNANVIKDLFKQQKRLFKSISNSNSVVLQYVSKSMKAAVKD